MAVNPNYPNSELGWGPLNNAGSGAIPLDRYVGLSNRTLGSIGADRGRQYELDQPQAGTLNAALRNDDGALDPTNSAGPWANRIAPYQPFRMRMQYPPTANLLLPGQSTCGDGYATGAIPAALDIFSTCDPSGGQIVNSATAYQGSNVFQFAVGAGNASGSTVAWTKLMAGKPGVTYTVQMRVRNITPSTSQSVKARISYYNSAASVVSQYGSPVTLVGSATASWSLIQFTYTLPANTNAIQVGWSVNSTSVACTLQMDAWQFEEGSTATAWGAASPWYPIFAGFVERWPTEWRDAGTFGVVSPTAVDAFALLSQKQLSDPLTEEINRRNPRFIYKLNDPQGSTSFADATGTYPPVSVGVSKYGAGVITPGTTPTATDPVGGLFTGVDGTVTNIANANSGTSALSAASFIDFTTAGITGPANSNGIWTRAIAFRYTGPMPVSGQAAVIWSNFDNKRVNDYPAGSRITMFLGDTGVPTLALYGPTAAAQIVRANGSSCVDGNWHLVIFGYSSGTSQILISLDGNTAAYIGGVSTTVVPKNLVSDAIGAWVDPGSGNGTIQTFSGDVSLAVEWPTFAGANDITALYSAWKRSLAGESTAARYARILGWSGYTGASSISGTVTTAMGPFKGNTDALSALQGVVDTENGSHFVAGDGTVTFTGRGTRYNATSPVWTFGERTDLGEFPYDELTLDYDSTHLANYVNVTQDSTGQIFSATDATSAAAYFPRSMSRTVNAASGFECQDAADYLLSRYSKPAVRITSMVLNPGANPALWPVCLALELGARVRVMRRAGAAPAMQLECFVEHLQWGFSDQNEATLTVQCSPVDPVPYAVFSAFHTTLSTSVSAGAFGFTINAPTDNTNQLVSQISVGTKLTLDIGTANEETVTVNAVGTTAPGWTTATIGCGLMSKSHAANAPVCEALPTGVTDPTKWNANGTFDSAYISY
jgi:hypothetical protein